MSLLSGCGVRGPLVMPKRPPEPTAPAAPDPGLGRPDAVYAPGAPQPRRRPRAPRLQVTMNAFFQRRDGELAVEQVPLSRIAAEFGTPTYVYCAPR